MSTQTPSGILRAVGKVVSSKTTYSCVVLLPTKAEYLQVCVRVLIRDQNKAAGGRKGVCEIQVSLVHTVIQK